jgi:hypothetical protein
LEKGIRNEEQVSRIIGEMRYEVQISRVKFILRRGEDKVLARTARGGLSIFFNFLVNRINALDNGQYEKLTPWLM